MQSFPKNFLAWATVAVAVAGATAAPLSSQVFQGPASAPAVAAAPIIKFSAPAKPAIEFTAPAQPVIAFAKKSAVAQPLSLRFETVRWGGKPVQTLDEASRIQLAKAAAERAGLHRVGLSFHDVYGIIEAETSWIPRTGASKNGTPNLGLAQFEPATARAFGVKDPGDPVQAVFGAAQYMKHGAEWAADRLEGLKLSPAQRAAKIREGVSVFYNLSVKGRNKWNGLNTADLPVETQRHIRNSRAGAAEAAELVKLLKT